MGLRYLDYEYEPKTICIDFDIETPHFLQFDFSQVNSYLGISGVYMITNTTKNLSYIGQSNNVGRRLKEHIKELCSGIHANQKMQADWTIETSKNFSFTLLKKVTNDLLLTEEKKFVSEYKTYLQYNLTLDGDKYSDLNKATPFSIAELEYKSGNMEFALKYAALLPNSKHAEKAKIIKELALKGDVNAINLAFINHLFSNDPQFLLDIFPQYCGSAGKLEIALIMERNNDIRCVPIYEELIKKGDRYATKQLGLLYKKGHLVEKDKRKGVELLLKANDAGVYVSDKELSFFDKMLFRLFS